MAIYSGFSLKMVIFHCYVSSPEGIRNCCSCHRSVQRSSSRTKKTNKWSLKPRLSNNHTELRLISIRLWSQVEKIKLPARWRFPANRGVPHIIQVIRPRPWFSIETTMVTWGSMRIHDRNTHVKHHVAFTQVLATLIDRTSGRIESP